MTDRFYPLGQAAHPEAWKTSYEVQNEMRSFDRSAYPPGTSIHLPGSRDRFGYGSPGPEAKRLAKPSLALTEDVDLPNPREHYAIPRMKEHNELNTFRSLDVNEMQRSYRSPMATITLSPGSRSFAMSSRTKSLPALSRKPAPPKLREPHDPISKLENDHFSYYVPQGVQRDGKQKIGSMPLSKLHKANKVSFPFSGSGTGFGGEKFASAWWPTEAPAYGADATAYRTGFTKPDFHRSSPLLLRKTF